MSDPESFRRDESDSERETRRGRLDRVADDYDAPGDWTTPSWRTGDRDDPRDRGTPFLAFLVVILLALVVTVALFFVIRQQDAGAPGVPQMRIERPSVPLPGAGPASR